VIFLYPSDRRPSSIWSIDNGELCAVLFFPARDPTSLSGIILHVAAGFLFFILSVFERFPPRHHPCSLMYHGARGIPLPPAATFLVPTFSLAARAERDGLEPCSSATLIHARPFWFLSAIVRLPFLRLPSLLPAATLSVVPLACPDIHSSRLSFYLTKRRPPCSRGFFFFFFEYPLPYPPPVAVFLTRQKIDKKPRIRIGVSTLSRVSFPLPHPEKPSHRVLLRVEHEVMINIQERPIFFEWFSAGTRS